MLSTCVHSPHNTTQHTHVVVKEIAPEDKIYIYIYSTTTDYHYTVQVARVQVQYLRQWLDEKAPPAQVAESDTTTCASGLFVPVAE